MVFHRYTVTKRYIVYKLKYTCTNT